MRAVEKRLREKVKELESRLAEVEEDREKFRKFIGHTLKEAIRIHGNGNYWRMENLIERLAHHLQEVKWFYW